MYRAQYPLKLSNHLLACSISPRGKPSLTASESQNCSSKRSVCHMNDNLQTLPKTSHFGSGGAFHRDLLR